MTNTTTRRQFTPNPIALYLGDNGQCLCGDHLGATATFSGRDLSGQPLVEVTRADCLAEGMDPESFRCERRTCGRGIPMVRAVSPIVVVSA